MRHLTNSKFYHKIYLNSSILSSICATIMVFAILSSKHPIRWYAVLTNLPSNRLFHVVDGMNFGSLYHPHTTSFIPMAISICFFAINMAISSFQWQLSLVSLPSICQLSHSNGNCLPFLCHQYANIFISTAIVACFFAILQPVLIIQWQTR